MSKIKDVFKSAWTTYLGIVIALFAMVSGVYGWVEPDLAWSLAGIFGFGSVASLRAYIEAQGIKTYVIAGIPIIFGILLAVGVINLEFYQLLTAAFAPLTQITLQQAKVKEKKLKLAA